MDFVWAFRKVFPVPRNDNLPDCVNDRKR